MKKFNRIVIICLILGAALCTFAACGSALPAPSGIAVNIDNVLTWDSVSRASNYEVEIRSADGSAIIVDSEGESVSNYTLTSRRTTVDLSNSSRLTLNEGDYIIRIRTMGKTSDTSDSEWSEEYAFHKDYETGCTYVLINNGTEYEVSRANRARGSIIIEDYYRGKPVTSIGTAAFKSSTVVTEIVLGANVKQICKNAFSGCSKLTKVVLPEGLKYIGDSAFKSCQALKEIEIPSTVETIGNDAFLRCRALEKIVIKEGVKSIGDYAFSDCLKVREVVIPDSVTSMGEFAFSTGDNLAKVTIGAGIETIEQYTFSHCPMLTDVIFSENSALRTISIEAFSYCSALESITLPAGLESIENFCFKECTRLKNLTLPSTLKHVGGGVVDATALYEASGEFVYADNWLVAYKNPNKGIEYLSKQQIGDNVYGIADFVFAGCLKLETVAMPESVKIVGKQAFVECQSLMTLNTISVEFIDYAAFAYCINLTTMKLGEGLKEIGAYAFYGCKSLDNNKYNPTATLPESVRRIGTYAFNDTAMWNKDEKGVVFAGKWAVGCNSVPTMQGMSMVDMGVSYAELYVDDEPCVGIADYTFVYQSMMTSVSGLENIRYIGKGAFYGCSSLTNVALNDDLQEIPDYAFSHCSELFTVTLPARLKRIGTSAFYDCSKLDNITIPNSVTELGDNAFYACYNLRSATLSKNLTEISDFAFFFCSSLTEIKIPDAVQTIGRKAFGRNMVLKNVEFGSGVKEIGYAAFYKNWLLQSIELPDNVETIENHAFYQGVGVESLKIGNGVKKIGDYAFYDLANLSSLYVPGTVETVGSYAFKGVPAKSLTISKDVKIIDSNAFYACYDATIYTDAQYGQDGWNTLWNSSQAPVIYDCELSEEGYVESVTIGENTFKHVNVVKVITNGTEAPDPDNDNDANPEPDDLPSEDNLPDGQPDQGKIEGESGDDDDVPNESEEIIGYDVVAVVGAPLREGYTFVGWATESGSSEVAYSAKDVTSAPIGTTLYAIWSKDE